MRRELTAWLLLFSCFLFFAQPPASAQQQSAGTGWPEVQPNPGGQAQAQPAYPDNNYPPQQQQQPAYDPQQAQQQPQQQQPAAGPSPQELAADRQHAVARLSVAQGEVNIKRGDNGDLVAAAVNAPLMSQDRVQTAQDGWAETELDYGNVVRIGPGTDVGFGQMQYQSFQVQLAAGTVIYRVLRQTGAQGEVDTASVGIRPTQPGEYRVSVFSDGSTQVTVRSGAADVMSQSGSQTLSGKQSMLVRGDSANPEFQSVSAPQFDQLDSFSRDRDHLMMNAQSYRYMSPDIAGGADLDANGSWVQSQYGEVWQPRVPNSDWAPYSDGNWTYEPYYGWTWVDSSPWGWAPYHYGRWFNNPGYGWCWWPGGVRASFWSPALVGFFGLGVGIGAGLGWVALAPFEGFARWWGGGFGFGVGFGFGWGHPWGGGFRGGIWGTYRNCGVRGGAIYGGAGAFGGHGGHFGPATRAQLAGATFVGGHLPVTPSHGSYNFSNRGAFSNARFTNASNTHFFHQQGMGRTQGGFNGTGRLGGNGVQHVGTLGGAQQQHGVAPGGSAQRAGTPGGASGWHSFGVPGNGSASRQGVYRAAGNQDGWHSFGQSTHGVPPTQRQNAGTYGGSAYSGVNRGGATYNGNAGRPASTYGGAAPSNRGSYGGSYSAPSAQQNRGFGGGANYGGSYSRGSYGGAYSAPQNRSYGGGAYGGGGHYSAPAAPHYSEPHYSAPHYSQPHESAPHYSAPHGGGGGGGGHYSGGGGGHSGGGGGHSGGGGGGHHR